MKMLIRSQIVHSSPMISSGEVQKNRVESRVEKKFFPHVQNMTIGNFRQNKSLPGPRHRLFAQTVIPIYSLYKPTTPERAAICSSVVNHVREE